MKPILKFSHHFTLPLLAFFLILNISTTGARTAPETDEGDDGETHDICNDGSCSCDAIEPYLISCVGNTLDRLYDEEEWKHTIKKNNLANLTLDFRADMNRITRITKFPQLNMSTLSFQNNQIAEIDPLAFADLNGLTSLDLSQNALTSKSLTEFVFEGVTNNASFYKPLELQHLNLSYNQIHSIEKDVFDHLPFLTSLDLSNNPLKILGSTAFAIASLRSLKSLTMANAELKSIPDALFHDLMHLEYLDLSDNRFETVPEEILNTHDLKVLILDKNRFQSLNEHSFEDLEPLQYLSISHIPTLKFIEANTFTTLKNLTVLKCHHNRQLSQISDDAFNKLVENDDEWPIKEIWLNDNALSHIDRELAAWPQIQYIDIQNNPFRCNCDLQWLAQVLVQEITRTQPHLVGNIKCSEPESLKGSGIVELGLEETRFSRCKPGSSSRQLVGVSSYDAPMDSYHATGITILIIGVILTTIALVVLGVIVIKRRAIAAALIAHHEIRYQKADTYDDDVSYRNSTSNSVYKVTV